MICIKNYALRYLLKHFLKDSIESKTNVQQWGELRWSYMIRYYALIGIMFAKNTHKIGKWSSCNIKGKTKIRGKIIYITSILQ